MAYTRCISLPVLAGFSVVLLVFYTTVFLVIQPWLGFSTAPGLLNLASFSLCSLMICVSYALSIFQDPGSVPPKYSSLLPQQPPLPPPHLQKDGGGRAVNGDGGDGVVVLHSGSSSGGSGGVGSSSGSGIGSGGIGLGMGVGLQQHHHGGTMGDSAGAADAAAAAAAAAATAAASSVLLLEVKRKGGEPRYCQKCCHYKPPRAHHCRVCKRCVLRMDHHCVWINNCVGHRNYKAFLLFVLYDVIAMVHSLVLVLGHATFCAGAGDTLAEAEQAGAAGAGVDVAALRRCISGGADSLFYPPPALATTLRVLCIMICIPLFLSLFVLLVWNGFLLLCNKTTIEHYEGVRARVVANKLGERTCRHPYDLGVFDNLVTILGPNPLCWLCPYSTYHVQSGVRFRTAFDSLLPTSSAPGAGKDDVEAEWRAV